jgi:DNA-binding GntR family transcriptional regulator
MKNAGDSIGSKIVALIQQQGSEAGTHLHVLELLERGRNEAASRMLAEHRMHTIEALSRIEDILQPPSWIPSTERTP